MAISKDDLQVGDTVEVLTTSDVFIKVGDIGVLLSQDEDGDWEADFSGNKEVADDGIWIIEEGYATCKKV